ncbi:MAG: poly-beta-1,6-N-acetyl-D-glucosamine N-deacetylase PgaB [Candidatus Adiutrix sp.]|nr:poly-beta-1,6-N-acetyl-D-glucosamine N-deacetylase PgaB [Candidatus Adiutrix sp.]
MNRLSAFIILLICLWPGPALAAPPEGVVTLAYHAAHLAPGGAPGGVPSIPLTELTDHFDWLKHNGYRVVGLDEVLEARSGGRPLPPKAVLLTFDVAHLSFYRAVYPLLRSYNYKAVLAVETGLLEGPAGGVALYGDEGRLPRSQFLTWGQLREMTASGLVEAASFSHRLHRGQPGNPQGLRQPAGAGRAYDADSGTYESAAEYRRRIRADWARSAAIIARRTGRRPRLAVWPYGLPTGAGAEAALEAGFSLTASRDVYSEGATLPRLMVAPGLNFPEAVAAAEAGLRPGHSGYSRLNLNAEYPAPFAPPLPLQRVMHVDVDALYDPDLLEQEENISALFDRALALKASAVYLRAYADEDGDGRAEALYFPGRHLPMRADLFNYLAWQLSRRVGAEVYAVMPLDFDWPGDGETPLPDHRRRTLETYEDLTAHALIDGIVFQDGPENPRTPIDFSLELLRAAERWSKKLKTARALDLSNIDDVEGRARLEEDVNAYLAAYDYVVVLAPLHQSRKNLEKAAKLVGKIPFAERRVVFEFQADGEPGAGRELAERMRFLRRLGLGHYGYFPENSAAGEPELRALSPVFSLQDTPSAVE